MKNFPEYFRSIAVFAFVVVALSGCGGGASPNPITLPVANAGSIQNVSVGMPVTLDGSASSAEHNIPLKFSWTLSTKPANSTAALSDATSPAPTFTPDVEGVYVAALIVSDGSVNSKPTTVTVNAANGNSAPVANAGTAQIVTVGTGVTLNGSASSDVNNGDTLTYHWTLTSKPGGSNAVLSDVIALNPTFTADLAGTYIATLVVNDGTVDSIAASVTITAAVGNVAPVANAGTAAYAYVGAAVSLNGSASSDANGDALTYSWTITTELTDSYAGLSGATTATPTFHAALPGVYVVTLIVNDGKVNSAAATVPITLTTATGYITLNGLLWMPVTSTTYTWPGANTYCANFTVNGTDWRLPTSAELGGLYTFVSGAMPYPAWTTANLWSSTSGNVYYNPSEVGHYASSMLTGETLVSSDTSVYNVTCVHP